MRGFGPSLLYRKSSDELESEVDIRVTFTSSLVLHCERVVEHFLVKLTHFVPGVITSTHRPARG